MSPRSVLLLGGALFLLYAFPGWMSTDSAVQLLEARSGRFSDAHPPLMSAMWRYLDMIVAGPILMLLLQLSLFLGGLYFILRRIVEARPAAWIAIGILLFPPVMTPMAVIWKDSQMAAFLIAGIAGVVQPRTRYRLLGAVLLVLACALRHNALAAVVPLVVVLVNFSKWARWQRVALAVGGGAMVVAGGFAVTKVLTTNHSPITPVWQDIVAVLACTDDRSDEDLREVLRGTPLAVDSGIQARARKLHSLRGAWRITIGDDRLFIQTSGMDWRPLNRAWRELVFGDPLAYFACHLDDFQYLLGIPEDSVWATVWNIPIENQAQMDWIEHNAEWSSIQYHLAWPLYWAAAATPLFTPWVYGAIGLLLLVLCCRDRLTFGLLASGFLYEASYFPFSPTPDYRYSHWMITVVCVATVILFIQRLRTRPA
ncbi:MAG: hypothetical protein AB7T06_01720 [Kofleriaceae bacterium]